MRHSAGLLSSYLVIFSLSHLPQLSESHSAGQCAAGQCTAGPCAAGEAHWPPDLSCYTLNTRGPCSHDRVFIATYQGPVCASFEEENDDTEPNTTTNTTITTPSNTNTSEMTEWRLPVARRLTTSEKKCLSEEKVYWPADGECYTLLTRGPCHSQEWLVVRGEAVTCVSRLCPCDPAEPELCEVELSSPACPSSPCVVGVAAAQEGHCDPGQELLVSPAGLGECGCRRSPPHLVWPEDGRCYSVYTRGPCSSGQVVRRGEDGEAVCEKEECRPGQLQHLGECHPLSELGHRGPCPHHHLLQLQQHDLLPHCVRDTRLDQRVFDQIPSIRVRFGPIPRTRKVQSCKTDRNGKCRKFSDRSSKNRINPSPRQYLRWLNKFRRKRIL